MLIIEIQKEYLKFLIMKIVVIIIICMFQVINYYLQMYLRILEICVLKYMNLFKETEVKLELLTNIDMLLMIEPGTTGGVCLAIYRYVEANYKYMKNYDENKESSYVQYLDANNLYGLAMSQKLPVDRFKWIKHTSSINKILKDL